MAANRQRGRAGEAPPARPRTENTASPAGEETGPETLANESLRKDTMVMSTNVSRAQTQMEGVTVIGEAVRRVPPESAEFLMEITTSAPTAGQALHDNQLKTAQVAQAV